MSVARRVAAYRVPCLPNAGNHFYLLSDFVAIDDVDGVLRGANPRKACVQKKARLAKNGIRKKENTRQGCFFDGITNSF